MHENSLARMAEMRDYVAPGSSVLDVGGADVNGSYRAIFADCRYQSLDFHDADIVVQGYDWPIESETYDAVVSGQTLEHDRFFWRTLTNIARVLCPGGVFLIVVPATWPIHRYPVDCYRFNPDAIDAFAEWMGSFEILKVVYDEKILRPNKPGWECSDLSAVLRKPGRNGERVSGDACASHSTAPTIR